MANIRRALRSDEPLDLLMTVSGLIGATDERNSPLLDRPESAPSLDNLVDSFIDVSFAETTAVLAVMQVLLEDTALASRIDAELRKRRHPLPSWIGDLPDARVRPEVSLMTDVLGDGDDYLIEMNLADGRSLTALVYVDANLGGVVKDSFVIPSSQEVVNDHFRSVGLAEGQVICDTDPAGARAIITDAIEQGSMLYPPIQTETWPMCRALVEWMTRSLPAGGSAPAIREWSEAELDGIGRAFMASPFAAGLTDPDHAHLLDSLLWFASGWSGTDPFRWSPVRVEILLMDWFPRKVMADAAFLSKFPDVLRAYVRYCQDRVQVPPSRRQETLDAIDEWEPQYQQVIRSARLQGPEALIASMMSGLDDDLDDALDDDQSFAQIMLSSLDRSVGGRIHLMNLDDSPLPDEPFLWAGIPEDIHPAVQQVLDECDRVAVQLFDIEHRTAMRRLLSRVASGDPVIFRRKASLARGAAAIGWLIVRANEEGQGQRYLTQELLTAFGVAGSVSARAEPMLKAIGIDPYRRYGSGDLGAVDLLTSATRASMITRRDRYLGMGKQ